VRAPILGVASTIVIAAGSGYCNGTVMTKTVVVCKVPNEYDSGVWWEGEYFEDEEKEEERCVIHAPRQSKIVNSPLYIVLKYWFYRYIISLTTWVAQRTWGRGFKIWTGHIGTGGALKSPCTQLNDLRVFISSLALPLDGL
jgi:hypothetical protein